MSVIPPERRCRGCGHRWPHGAVLRFQGRPTQADTPFEIVADGLYDVWAEGFCDECDDPCPTDAPSALSAS